MRDDMAFPGFAHTTGYGCSKRNQDGGWETHETGLTKREWFAGLALQGMLSNSFVVESMFNAKNGKAQDVAREIVEQSVACADRVIAELEKK